MNNKTLSCSPTNPNDCAPLRSPGSLVASEAMVLAPNGATLYVAKVTGSIASCDIATNRCSPYTSVGAAVSGGLAISPSGDTLYAGLDTGVIVACPTTFNATCTALDNASVGWQRKITALALSGDGSTLWAGVSWVVGEDDLTTSLQAFLWKCPTATPNACAVWQSWQGGSSGKNEDYYATHLPSVAVSPGSTASTGYVYVTVVNQTPDDAEDFNVPQQPPLVCSPLAPSSCGQLANAQAACQGAYPELGAAAALRTPKARSLAVTYDGTAVVGTLTYDTTATCLWKTGASAGSAATALELVKDAYFPSVALSSDAAQVFLGTSDCAVESFGGNASITACSVGAPLGSPCTTLETFSSPYTNLTMPLAVYSLAYSPYSG